MRLIPVIGCLIGLLVLAGCLMREVVCPDETPSGGDLQAAKPAAVQLPASQHSEQPAEAKKPAVEQTSEARPNMLEEPEDVISIVAKDASIMELIWWVSRMVLPRKPPENEPLFDNEAETDLANARIEGWLVKEKITVKEFTEFVEEEFNLRFVIGSERVTVKRADPLKRTPKVYKGSPEPPKEISHARFRIKFADGEERYVDEDLSSEDKVKYLTLFKQHPISRFMTTVYDRLRFICALYGTRMKFEERRVNYDKSKPNWEFFALWPPDEFELTGLPDSYAKGRRVKFIPENCWADNRHGGVLPAAEVSFFNDESEAPARKVNVKDIVDILGKPLPRLSKKPPNVKHEEPREHVPAQQPNDK